jgi:hypothetical protein
LTISAPAAVAAAAAAAANNASNASNALATQKLHQLALDLVNSEKREAAYDFFSCNHHYL